MRIKLDNVDAFESQQPWLALRFAYHGDLTPVSTVDIRGTSYLRSDSLTGAEIGPFALTKISCDYAELEASFTCRSNGGVMGSTQHHIRLLDSVVASGSQ